ncbi:MFS transporter [Benzoatithermus flavus]|uniref:MFS transporter n=1 Tax=Benzoatithermus flavus TaxID=3108223 RepID=A0ABU8XTZ6_9PROT
MLTILRQTWALLAGIALLMLGHGLQGTLLGVRANLEAFPAAITGFVMSGYYIGLLLGSFSTPRLVSRVGHVRVFAALLSLGSTAILFHALFIEPLAWFAMRLLTGYCFAGAFIVAESWLNGSATNETRGRLLSLYMVVQMGGLAAGQFLLNLADPKGFALFMLVSVLISVASVPMLLTASPAPAVSSPRGIGLWELYRVSPLGVVGIVGVGVAHSGLYSMGPVFAAEEGLSVAAISVFMAAVILGGVVFQVPIGRLSDRLDRRWVIVAATLLTAVVALPPALFPDLPRSSLFPGFFLVGGLSLPLYAVCVAHTNDFLSPEQMVGASSALILGYGLGAAIGPTLTASAMQLAGPSGFPLFLALVHGAIGLFAFYRMTRRPTVPAEERGPYIVLPAPSPVVTPLAQKSARAQPEDQSIEPVALADAG